MTTYKHTSSHTCVRMHTWHSDVQQIGLVLYDKLFMFNFHRVCELWCGETNGSISIFTICENIVTSHEIVNHYEPMIDNINVLNLVSTHCPLYHEGDDLTVCSYVYPGKMKCKFSLLRSYMPISSWLPTLSVQLPLLTFGVYLWHPWNVETFGLFCLSPY